jgi:hypothetical protein
LAHGPVSAPAGGHDARRRQGGEPAALRRRRRAGARRRRDGDRFGRELRPRRARALAENSDLEAEAIVRKGLAIAAEICVYTNANVVVETLDAA